MLFLILLNIEQIPKIILQDNSNSEINSSPNLKNPPLEDKSKETNHQNTAKVKLKAKNETNSHSNFYSPNNLEVNSHQKIHKTISGINATRSDVVNKTIIRAAKRYFCKILLQEKTHCYITSK